MKQNLSNKVVFLSKTQLLVDCGDEFCIYDVKTRTAGKKWSLIYRAGNLQFRVFDISADRKWLCLAG
ncbi:MAG: hypothetical protein K5Q00_01135, partial [Gammaproteobacteria bacterium]|nr:hypothetical protein [Gammaproteobacteria bacterium]